MSATSLELVRATSVDDACGALDSAPGRARVLNGGTELARQLREGEIHCDLLVDVKRLPGFRAVTQSDGGVSIGAAVKHWDVAESPLVRERAPALAKACGGLGNVRVRAQGSLGGNLAYGHAQTDPGTVLLAHGARLEVASKNGNRTLDVEQLWRGDCQTSIEAGELVCHVAVDPLPAGWRWDYRRVEVLHRPPNILVATLFLLSGTTVEDVRISLGGVAETPLRLRQLESRLRGESLAGIPTRLREWRAKEADDVEPRADQVFAANDKIDVACNLLAATFRRAKDDR